MIATIEYVDFGYTAYNEKKEMIGRCCYVVHEDSYYNSVDDSWTCNRVNLLSWLKDSLKNVYKNISFKEA